MSHLFFRFNITNHRYCTACLDGNKNLTLSVRSTEYSTVKDSEGEEYSWDNGPLDTIEGEAAWKIFYQHCSFNDLTKHLTPEDADPRWREKLLNNLDFMNKNSLTLFMRMIADDPLQLYEQSVLSYFVDMLILLRDGADDQEKTVRDAMKSVFAQRKRGGPIVEPANLLQVNILLEKLTKHLRTLAQKSSAWPGTALTEPPAALQKGKERFAQHKTVQAHLKFLKWGYEVAKDRRFTTMGPVTFYMLTKGYKSATKHLIATYIKSSQKHVEKMLFRH